MANQIPGKKTSDISALWAKLNAIFEQDITATSQLLELLETERKALETRSYDDFHNIIADKQDLLSQLETHANNRQQLLLQAGFKNEASTLDAAEHQAPVVATAWRTLKEQWERCQKLNEINERITKRTRLVAGQILDVLRGQANQQKLYDDKGNAHNAAAGRTITSA